VLQDPGRRIDDHVDEFADDVIIGLMQFLPDLLGEITAFYGKTEPGLGLCRFGLSVIELADKGRRVPPLTPRLLPCIIEASISLEIMPEPVTNVPMPISGLQIFLSM